MIKDKSSYALSELGARIRTARMERGMTQSELAGGDITRNMLSRIENGAALPSLPSLCAIAARLDLPVSALLDDPTEYATHRLYGELRDLIEKRDFKKAVSVFDGLDIKTLGSDMRQMLSKAFTEYAFICYSEGRLTDAAALIVRVENIGIGSEKSLVLKELIQSCQAIEAKSTEAIPTEELRRLIFSGADEAVYLYSLKLLEGLEPVSFSVPHERAGELRASITPLIEGIKNGVYKAHIEAKLDMISAEYLAAKATLLKIAKDDVPPPILWAIYADIEYCSKCCYDFENANKYSGLRLELIKKIT